MLKRRKRPQGQSLSPQSINEILNKNIGLNKNASNAPKIAKGAVFIT